MEGPDSLNTPGDSLWPNLYSSQTFIGLLDRAFRPQLLLGGTEEN
jgi:hypothetical protein